MSGKISLVPKYLANRRDDVAWLRTALEVGDHAAIARAGHKMKGSGAGYGFAAISRLGDELQSAARAKDSPGVDSCLDRLERFLTTVRWTAGE